MVADKKAPTPYCIHIASALMSPEAGNFVEVPACYFNLYSIDNCTDEDDLIYTFDNVAPVAELIDEVHYFDENGESTRVLFDQGRAQRWDPQDGCSTVKFVGTESCGENQLKMTVWDEAGNYDHCDVTLVIAGNSCPDVEIGSRMIAGQIMTIDDRPVEEVSLTLDAQLPEYPHKDISGDDGSYAFPGNEMYNDYRVTPKKDVDHLNGVSTLDIVLTIRHILGIEEFDIPYYLIAADANNDRKVSSSDLIVMRKLILGIYDEFPNNDSWRFVSQDDKISMEETWPFVETRDIVALDRDMMFEDFIGVKIGDVNGSFRANANERSIETRSNENLGFIMETTGDGDIIFKAGDNYMDIFGFQFTLSLDGEYEKIIPGALAIGADNVHAISDKMLNISYAYDQGEWYEPGTELFTIIGGEQAHIDHNHLTDEAYMGEELSILGVELSNEKRFEFSLEQNVPNPWAEYTSIGFSLPESGIATVVVRDITGKKLITVQRQFNKGLNHVDIKGEDLPVSGVLIYEVIFGEERLNNRMIKLR
jgi:hypothetical protein